MKDPPKKKHVKRPRPEVVRLSEAEQVAKARAELRKAVAQLEAAELLATRGDTPDQCAHAAYYSMYHAACAVLLMGGGINKRGDVPDNHRDVVLHYGTLVAAEGPSLSQSGAVLNDALNGRMVADYFLDQGVEAVAAKVLSTNARTFVDAIVARWPKLIS